MFKKIFIIFLLPLVVFWQSFNAFFTNDDFYFLRIVKDTSLPEILNYFNLFTKNYEGLGVYRPLTTQIFYLINNPLIMHIVVFITFFAILYLIYKLGVMLFKSEKVSLISAFLYAVSATHFAHFYYLATYQELGMTLFVLLMIISYLNKKYYLSILFFVLGLMSKETAVIAPFILILVDWYKNNKITNKKIITVFLILLSVYLLSHFYLYGLVIGDSYVWDFSIKRFLNTVVWYLLWSLNLPETLIDFIGPGLAVNPNLFKYWASTIYPILGLFVLELLFIAGLMIKFLDKLDNKKNSLLGMAWFLISLMPVVFLPQHKFSFYLTLPLIGIAYRIAYLLEENKVKKVWLYSFMAIWFATSVLTIRHSLSTSWITNGQKISVRVLVYFKSNSFSDQRISLVDTSKDSDLPWSPTTVVKNALSDKNFFYVYFPKLADKIEYDGKNRKQIESRQFLGY